MVAQLAGSHTLGSMCNGFNSTTSPNNPNKVIKKIGLFQFKEDLNLAPWHVPSPLDLRHSRVPLPKYSDHLPKFSGNGKIWLKNTLVHSLIPLTT